MRHNVSSTALLVMDFQNDIVHEKGKFAAWGLAAHVKEQKALETLLLAGVATNFVVEECARTAAAKDYEVIVLEDCCASMNQMMHDFPIKNILPNLV